MQVDLAARPIVLSGTYDVVVAGGGPAGCAAATAAAQEGTRVLLLEATGALGGMGTMG
jgi:flavin-dependent dehydrogenase